MKHLFIAVLRTNPVLHFEHWPVLRSQFDMLQFMGQSLAHDPEIAVKPSMQTTQLPDTLQVIQLL